jgi:hypothetical protein
MTISKTNTFCISSSAGGPEAGHLYVHIQRLYRLFLDLRDERYCSEIDWYGVFLHIDGSLVKHHVDGVGRIVLSKRSRDIVGNVGIQEANWKGRTPHQVRQLLAGEFRIVFSRFVDRIQRAQIDFDDKRFLRDTDSVLHKFLADPEPYNIPELQSQVEAGVKVLNERQSSKLLHDDN